MSNDIAPQAKGRSDAADIRALQAAMLHCEAGRLADAKSLCENILLHSPHQAEAIHLLAILSAQLGHGPRAIDLFHHCIRLRPDWGEAHVNLAIALRGQQRVDEAITAAQRAIQLMPSCAAAHYHLGAAHYENAQPNLAASSFRRVLEIDSSHAHAMNDLAVC
ncbi:MAG TPA: tetratricopeptide repeat protein, partial [Tepidisphaeraceae bacterium]